MMHAQTRRLIVNADDFGMTSGVNRAVAELHDSHVLTSTTLMACGARFEEAVRIAQERPALGVGCHVVLVDGQPTARGGKSSLVAPNGELSSSMADFAAGVQARFVRVEDIQTEAAAQIAKLQDAGVTVTHVDTHKHTHLLPRVSRAVMRAAKSRGVTRIRNPFEPSWASQTSPAPLARKVPFRILHQLRGRFERLASEEGMQTTDGSIGLIATGTLDSEVLARLLSLLPEGTFELVCHPGYNDPELQQVRTRLRQTREVEREALLSVMPRYRDSVRLGSFGALL